MRALLLDAGLDRGSLAAARALVADGWTVGVGSPFRGLAAWSRAVSRWHEVPSPVDGADGLIAAARAAIANNGYEIVFSSDDEGVVTLVERRDELGAAVPYGSKGSVLASQDKLELTRAAQAAGLAVPRTSLGAERNWTSWEEPVVIKPRMTFGANRQTRLDARVFASAGSPETSARAAEIEAAGVGALIQERVAGELMALTVLADQDHELIAAVQQRSETTWPPGAGVSARARTVPVDPALAEGVARLVRSLEWFGLAQVQFIAPAQGPPRLLDFNGRFYGSLALAIGAGVNLPAIWARLATGRPVQGAPAARVGVRFQWLWRDLQASGVSEGGRLRGAARALAEAPGAVHSVWSARDPWPALRHYPARLFERTPAWMRRS